MVWVKQAVCVALAAGAAENPHVQSVLAGEGAGGWRELMRVVRGEARGARSHQLALRRLLPSLDHVSAVVEVREKRMGHVEIFCHRLPIVVRPALQSGNLRLLAYWFPTI